MTGAALFAACVSGSLGVGECSPSAGGKVVGEACTRTSECLNGLICQTGVCASADAGPRDAGTPSDASMSAQDTP